MKRAPLLFLLLLLLGVLGFAQQAQTATPAQNQSAPDAQRRPDQRPAGPNTVQGELNQTSREAAGDEEENAEFKRSPVVRKIAQVTGLSDTGAYWVLYILDFAIIAVLIGWLWKKNVPAAFRSRTESIRKALDEARRASEEATRRLSDIEGRLSKLDTEIAQMRATAEKDAAAEEQRIRAAAEEDAKRIITSAENEIEAASKAAQRELKTYAAELAVALAEKRIRVDAKTDQKLVRSFVHDLGQSSSNGTGKERA